MAVRKLMVFDSTGIKVVRTADPTTPLADTHQSGIRIGISGISKRRPNLGADEEAAGSGQKSRAILLGWGRIDLADIHRESPVLVLLHVPVEAAAQFAAVAEGTEHLGSANEDL
jgi:hypothetical protein